MKPLRHIKHQASPYPLQRRFAIWGVLAGIMTGLLFQSALAGFSFVVIFLSTGALWRRDEVPILPYCIAYQWLFVVSGFFYWQVTGTYPGFGTVGDMESAVLLCLIGLCVLTVGIRSANRVKPGLVESAHRKLTSFTCRYNISRLFWWVIVLQSINFFFEINPKLIAYSMAEIIKNVLAFRGILFIVLLLAIFRQRQGYLRGLTAIVYATIPNLASYMSAFAGAFILLFVVLLSEWRPWSGTMTEARRSRRMIWAVVGMALVLFGSAMVWQGAVKHQWRYMINNRAVEDYSILEKVMVFTSLVPDSLGDINPETALAMLSQRTSSGLFYFSYVLERVPDIVPHEDGALTWRVFNHIIKPRFLFPEKLDLGSDSWLIWKYAGLAAAGAEQGTSIGLSYMAQFYIDFGAVGMFVPILCYGFIIGLIYRLFILACPSYVFYLAAIISIFMSNFTTFEGEIAKLIGGLIQQSLICAVILIVIGPWLQRKLIIPHKVGRNVAQMST